MLQTNSEAQIFAAGHFLAEVITQRHSITDRHMTPQGSRLDAFATETLKVAKKIK